MLVIGCENKKSLNKYQEYFGDSKLFSISSKGILKYLNLYKQPLTSFYFLKVLKGLNSF